MTISLPVLSEVPCKCGRHLVAIMKDGDRLMLTFPSCKNCRERTTITVDLQTGKLC